MTDHACLIDNRWRPGRGEHHRSANPATGGVVWDGPAASAGDVADAVAAARTAQPRWEASPFDERQAILERFAELVDGARARLRAAISAEVGKPRWEADTEVSSVKGKVALSVAAYNDRTPTVEISPTAALVHRPLGVMAVLGPFNFPAHLPNGHIVPALLAGNTVVYKPSEHTPQVATIHAELLVEAGLPPGVLNVVIGGRSAGEALVDTDIDGLAFTGSAATGTSVHRALAGRPDVLLALEMGGNNPLVVGDIDDVDAAVKIIIWSAFITAGQRCTCARRLYLPAGSTGDQLLDALADATARLRVGPPDRDPEPFMGPVISPAAAERIRTSIAALTTSGATLVTNPGAGEPDTGFVSPTLVVCDGVEIPDDEIFGPALTVQRYSDLASAFDAASRTRYGLAAGLISTDPTHYQSFRQHQRAGIINWNAPTTGASGRLPFGGTGISGNHRPAGWYSADYCAYPVALNTNPTIAEGAAELPGFAAPST